MSENTNKGSLASAPLNEEANEAITNSMVASDHPSENRSIVKPETAVKAKESVADINDLEKIDYDAQSYEDLLNRVKVVIKTYPIDQIRAEVEAIKTSFYKKLKIEHAELKEKFIESGELEENFSHPVNLFEVELKEQLNSYRDKRTALNESADKEKESNLVKKLDVIEKIKALVNGTESLNHTFHEFKDLQQKWRDIGAVPQSHLRDMWANYNYAIENFYSYIKINNELRDLDLKRNFEAKLEICNKVEQLLLETNIIEAFNTLQKYHDQWREIGPVVKDKKDEIWDRFKDATTLINKKHQEHFEEIKEQLNSNLEAKTELCIKAEALIAQTDQLHTPKDWENLSKDLIEIQQLWKTIGFAPKKENTQIYERFRTACDKYFELKREFFKHYKSDQHTNLQLKTELCLQAEGLKESTDWKKTTDELIKIQKRWKEIGPVPHKNSDVIWKRFRTACDNFFDHKTHHFSHLDEEQTTNLNLKNQIIEELKAFNIEEKSEDTFAKLQDFQKRWAEVGHVPFKEKDKINQDFRGLINKMFDNLKMDEYHKNVSKFNSKLQNMPDNNQSVEKMSQERNKIIAKLKQLETDITLWENNIGFFAKSKNADLLVKDFLNKIASGKQNVKLLNEKLDLLDNMLKH